jgi:hypothetical protein
LLFAVVLRAVVGVLTGVTGAPASEKRETLVEDGGGEFNDTEDAEYTDIRLLGTLYAIGHRVTCIRSAAVSAQMAVLISYYCIQ